MGESITEGIELLKSEMDYPEHRGSFAIGAYADLVLYHLPPIVQEFRAEQPLVQIKLTAGSYSNLMGMVSSGELDIIIGTRPQPESQSLEFRPLFESDFVLMTPIGHELLELPEISLVDIAQWPLFVLEPASFSRRALEQALKQEGLRYDIALEITIAEIAKRYVEIGMGIAVILEYGLQPEDRDKAGIRKLTDIFPSAQMGLITLRGKYLGRSAGRFIELLEDRLGQAPRLPVTLDDQVGAGAAERASD